MPALFTSCDDKAPPQTAPPTQQPSPSGAPAGHGAATDLGTLTVAGKQFGITRLGDLTPGVEGAFEVHPKGIPAGDVATLNVYVWVESQDGTQLSAPAKAMPEGDVLHAHVTPKKDAKSPFRVVLRLRAGSTDERASLPLDGHGHEHVEGAHHGVPATFKGGEVTGHLELKLHDDKGDLELWLTEDAAGARPFDLPLDASVEIEFVDVSGRKVMLRPRNTTKNEDEDGNASVRDGKTNYFIFPSRQGDDANWLMGKTFQSIVVVRFVRDGKAFASEEFVLKPHVH